MSTANEPAIGCRCSIGPAVWHPRSPLGSFSEAASDPEKLLT
jgi:hypothetical protein